MKNITPSKCPNCGYLSDVASPVDNPNDIPQQGSICICMKCGNINQLDAELKLVEVTEEEMNQIKAESPVEYYEILDLSNKINEAKILE